MAQRYFMLPVAAIAIVLVLFLLMQMMIKPDGTILKGESERTYLNFVRVKPSQQNTQTKDRSLPEPPPDTPPPPETPNVEVSSNAKASSPQLSMNLPSLNMPLNNADGPFLGAPGSGGGLAGFDSEVIPVVQVAPVYPRNAKQAKIEGYVTLSINIRPDGSVSRAKVIESKPRRLFDDSAKQAILRWKFRPKIVDGQAVGQDATQTIEFTLSAG